MKAKQLNRFFFIDQCIKKKMFALVVSLLNRSYSHSQVHRGLPLIQHFDRLRNKWVPQSVRSRLWDHLFDAKSWFYWIKYEGGFWCNISCRQHSLIQMQFENMTWAFDPRQLSRRVSTSNRRGICLTEVIRSCDLPLIKNVEKRSSPA